MKYSVSLLLVLLAITSPVRAETEEVKSPATAPQELLNESYLYEMTQHLYRWYMDEADVLNAMDDPTFTFWVRSLNPELDEGDKSRLAEIIMPNLHLSVQVKQADYTIEEMNVVVSNETFKIINVSRISSLDEMPNGYTEVTASYKAMKEYLFKARSRTAFPEGALLERLRKTLRKKLRDDARYHNEKLPKGEQIDQRRFQRVFVPLPSCAHDDDRYEPLLHY